ncbi:hypothetical protein J2D73_12505 [Acetobacter sacchari]|uniref:Uncharacterized protein n=1 Tax=Acetobacter sacchari TaxID=2661687 RepID=A0ABS3LXH2_9PROT|nr:hypothetical protein [Acetobacter sacchari]MBO1360609.1 hypothetical protein [Acetobacter sacchari]
MNTAAITAIVQLVVAMAEEVPNIVSVIEDAIAASKSGDGPTDAQIAAALAAADTTNASIQSS